MLDVLGESIICNRILYTMSLEAIASGQKWHKDVQIMVKGFPLNHSW